MGGMNISKTSSVTFEAQTLDSMLQLIRRYRGLENYNIVLRLVRSVHRTVKKYMGLPPLQVSEPAF